MEAFLWIIFIVPAILVILFLFIASLVWAYRDAEKRGKPGWLVALMVFFVNWPFSLLIWLVFRPEVLKVEERAI